MANFDYSMTQWHPEKDLMPGAYEWWYFDAHMDNGYSMVVIFCSPTIVNLKYLKYLSEMDQGNLPPYNSRDYAQVKLMVINERGEPLFRAEQDITADQIRMADDSLDVYFSDKNHLVMKFNGNLPDFLINVDVEDGKGNSAKAELIFHAMVPGVNIGRGAVLDAEVDGTHLYHKWVILAPMAKVEADVAITGADGTINQITAQGRGYHDKNWGNHPMSKTTKGWIWSSVKEGDLTIVFAEVPNKVLSYPTYTPIVIAYKNEIIVSTEAVEVVRGSSSQGRLPYPLETTVKFLPDSRVKGELKYFNLTPFYEQGPYVRLRGEYSLNMEFKDEKIEHKGHAMFEFTDFIKGQA